MYVYPEILEKLQPFIKDMTDTAPEAGRPFMMVQTNALVDVAAPYYVQPIPYCVINTTPVNDVPVTYIATMIPSGDRLRVSGLYITVDDFVTAMYSNLNQ